MKNKNCTIWLCNEAVALFVPASVGPREGPKGEAQVGRGHLSGRGNSAKVRPALLMAAASGGRPPSAGGEALACHGLTFRYSPRDGGSIDQR